MDYTNSINLSDLLILHDESEMEISDFAYEYYMPGVCPTKRLAGQFHKALKLNIAMGETLLEAMAEEVAFPSMATISDQAFPVAECTLPFMQEATRVQKSMAESHDTIREIEKKFRFLGSPRHIAI